MSTLKDRLSRLGGMRRQPAAPPASASAASPGWESLGAEVCGSEAGSWIGRRLEYPLEHQHGRRTLEDFLQSAEQLESLTPGCPVEADKVLFMDAETTGLGIGAGNVPFMIGIGYYRARSFIVEQLFIRNPAEELAMLHRLKELFGQFTHLITYNGKSFDWPVLHNRFVLNRVPWAFDHLQHIDVLYPSRSLWRTVLSSCRLSIVEEDRLGIARQGDVPGSEAPALYFRYLAEGRPELLEGVFRHNEWDVLSMAALAAHLCGLLRGEADFAGMEAEELFRTGMWLIKAGKGELGEQAFNSLLERDEELTRYCLPLAAHYKKQGRLEPALALWKRKIRDDARDLSPEPYIELSMHYEHRLKDIPAALAFAEQALERERRRLQLLRGSRAGTNPRAMEELRKRLGRLKRKLEDNGRRSAGARRRGSGDSDVHGELLLFD